jgi:uncharacterized protein (TIGR02996 family)
MIERGFLDVLRHNPVDEFTRLAYADWLEERGDRRAEVVRLDLAWFSGDCTLLRLSEAACGADLAWLAEVSLLARLVESRWGEARGGFSLAAGTKSAVPWAKGEEKLRSILAHRPRAPAHDLVIPLDYALFHTLFPGLWRRTGGPGVAQLLWDAELVPGRTAHWYEDGAPRAGRDPEMWLSIGEPWSRHEEHFLCCGRSSPLFGLVATIGDDSHPMNIGVSDGDTIFPGYLEFLRSLALPRDGP